MRPIHEQIRTIVCELARLQNVPLPFRGKDGDFQFSGIIEAGIGGSIAVTRTIDNAIAAVANQLKSADHSLALKVTRAEWRASVRHAFGPVLAKIDLDRDPDENARTILAQIRTVLKREVADYGTREFAFGCTLFGNDDIKPFSLGPVRFESRLDWLARKSADGAMSATTRRRVEKKWSGRRLRKRKPSSDSLFEPNILDAVGTCPFVCSVTTTGLAAEAGREKALTAARLAIAAIALLLQTPSRALAGMNLLFDRQLHDQTTLIFAPEKLVSAGTRMSQLPAGPRLKSGEWETALRYHKNHFRVVGEILAYVVDPAGNAARPKLISALTQALLWFHEACRETVALMAIVKFSASLDALACGGKSGGIVRLINARLGISDSQTIRKDGPTLKQAVDEIYSDGRSRTMHGTNAKLSHDWSGTRGMAEQLARGCLLSSIAWAANNSRPDDPKQLSR